MHVVETSGHGRLSFQPSGDLVRVCRVSPGVVGQLADNVLLRRLVLQLSRSAASRHGCVESLRQRIADLRAERPEVTETMEFLKEGVKQ
jgi:hypothetical protein